MCLPAAQLEALSSPKCLFRSSGLEMYQVCILMGLAMLPVVLLLKIAYAFMRKEI